jgi:hypothetical protein
LEQSPAGSKSPCRRTEPSDTGLETAPIDSDNRGARNLSQVIGGIYLYNTIEIGLLANPSFSFSLLSSAPARVSSSPKAVVAVAVAAAVVRNKPVVASPPLAAAQRVRSYAAVGVVARGAAGVPLEHVD